MYVCQYDVHTCVDSVCVLIWRKGYHTYQGTTIFIIFFFFFFPLLFSSSFSFFSFPLFSFLCHLPSSSFLPSFLPSFHQPRLGRRADPENQTSHNPRKLEIVRTHDTMIPTHTSMQSYPVRWNALHMIYGVLCVLEERESAYAYQLGARSRLHDNFNKFNIQHNCGSYSYIILMGIIIGWLYRVEMFVKVVNKDYPRSALIIRDGIFGLSPLDTTRQSSKLVIIQRTTFIIIRPLSYVRYPSRFCALVARYSRYYILYTSAVCSTRRGGKGKEKETHIRKK
jgi:hypothetical protein